MHLISWNKFVQHAEENHIYLILQKACLDKVIITVTGSEQQLFLQRLNTEEFHQLNCIPLEVTGADAFMELVFAHC